ncbi:RWD domain-containing protein 2A isoform X2 [Frieseomelitta varia]|uniref:RWD domain-containing protein 2A isoform X2 n=1 Tax=Frieseomelitta varia TaxID=561572 RepID=UPI001CB69331|nr:RWD domain-containing protein 2A isoform X2 [Frieseomelitta varia]
MSTYEEIKQNLEIQISELEVLQSIYPKELVIADYGVLADVNEFVRNPMQEMPQRLEYSVHIPLSNEKPEIYARGTSLNRSQQLSLNQALNSVLERQEDNEPCIHVLITWLQDNGEEFLKESTQSLKRKDRDTSNMPTDFARYWIYSHHIYSRFKRKKIVDLAKSSSLTGFCLAGKPGAICIEGALEDCDYCWHEIKSLKWQKITLKLIEKEQDCKDINAIRKFENFKEILFTNDGRQNNLGQMLKYLADHESQHTFRSLFDIESKMAAKSTD